MDKEKKQKEIVVKGIKLHPGQKKLLDYIEQHPQMMFFSICCSRQWGKTTFLVQYALKNALENPKTNTLICSPTYAQSKILQKKILNGLPSMIKTKDAEDNSLTLINGSVIYLRSVQIWDNLRSLSIHYMYLDECAMYPSDEVFDGALRPMLSTVGRKCFLISTAKGKGNFFYKLFQLGLNENEERYGSFTCTYRDNPYANLEEIEACKKHLPERLYRQEFEATFEDDGGDVFSNVRTCAVVNEKKPVPGEKYYAGIDLANTGEDFTVCTIINDKGEVVKHYRNHNTEWRIIVNDLVRILKEYHPQTYVEVNGLGSPIFEQLNQQYRCSPWVTTNQTKQEIIENLILAFQEKEISIPKNDFPELIQELEDFTFKYSKATRSIRYEARTGHDDTVIATSLAWYAKKKLNNQGHYIFA